MSRKLNDTNVYNLNNKLSSYNWNDIFEDENPDTAFNSFINIFKSLYDNCCPYTSTKIPNNKIKNKPWISLSIQKCIPKKNVLYKKCKVQNSTDIKNRYLKYKNILTKIIRYSKKKYFEEKLIIIILFVNDSKNKWKVVNKLLNPNNNANIKCQFNNNSPIEYKQTANSFNDYFCNIGRKLADNINIRNINNIYNFSSKLVNNNTFFFYPTNKTEIINIVENSKNKKSNDLFHINMDILKKTIYVISPIPEYLFNLSISKGKFPNILKISKVIPLFKNGDKSNITNYRPISLISQFAKIFEKIIKIRMISFIDKYDLIHISQFCFQKNIDTSFAINMLMNDLIRNLENKYISSIVSIDLKKAFDTINHDI